MRIDSATSAPEERERCARCDLDVAAWRVEVASAVYCTSFCAHAAGALDFHDDEREQPGEAP